MSYTSELKNDLFENFPQEEEARYLISGIILGSGRFDFKNDQIGFTISSENSAFIRYFYQLMFKDCNVKGIFNYQEKSGIHKNKFYSLSYPDIGKVLKDLGCLQKLGEFYYSPILNDILFNSRKAQKAFLKGVFISCGTILNPQTNYHLELDSHYSTVIEVCYEVLKSLGIACSMGVRKNREVLYIKESGAIADFLALIEANRKYFEFEDMVIFKQMRGDINRRINFETANINKTALAASKQINSIEYLKKINQYESLPDELKKAAELRLAHPTISINKLIRKADFPISRSSLHRRLSRIIEIAKKNE